MDHSLPVVPDDGDLRWSDSHSMHSDNMHSDDMHSAGLSSPWLGSHSSSSTSVSLSSSTVGFSYTGQLSPISNGVDVPPAALNSSVSLGSPSQSPSPSDEPLSATSSVPSRAWSLDYHDSAYKHLPAHNPEGHGSHRRDSSWDESSDDVLVVPKPEPEDDDDFYMEDVDEAPSTPIPMLQSHLLAGSDEPKPKRPRGRPRKHPLVPLIIPNKITKGRSKTGCLTCRRRKKKCDEAKPRCMNCEKNGLVCQGYPEKQIWKSGKEKAEEERRKARSFPSITLQPLFQGLETVEDRIFWKHYNERLSTVLTVEGEHKNAFRDMMVPVAVQHTGLMHSILSLASKHIDFETPYGINLLKKNPNTTLQALRERSVYHHDQARKRFCADIKKLTSSDRPATGDKTLVCARYGQMLCFVLEALVEGNPWGELRLHLSMYRNLTAAAPFHDSAQDSEFLCFVTEFFQYYIFADDLIHSALKPDAGSSVKRLPEFPPGYSPRLLGVTDGLLHPLSETTSVRNMIRSRIRAHIDPPFNYQDLYHGTKIDDAIRTFVLNWPSGDVREQVALLYQQMMSIYLSRTMNPPSLSPPSSLESSTASLALCPRSPSHPWSVPPVVDTPPTSASTSCASSPRFAGLGGGPNALQTGRPDRRSHVAAPRTLDDGNQGVGGSRSGSPAPTRQPPNFHPTFNQQVEEALESLEWFNPSDPCQTLLLLPCFLVGTVCFKPAQQKRVRAAIQTVRAYTGFRNADPAVQVLEEVWRLMEAGDWVAVWDWPGVVERLGLDFIPA